MIDYLPFPARIAAIDRKVADNHVFTFAPAQPLNIAPGQFVEITLPGLGAFPVSISAVTPGATFESCIRRIGRVTSALYQLEAGAAVYLRGPFGNGFPLESFDGRAALLIAGGLGMAPLMGLLRALLQRRGTLQGITVLYGARDREDLLFRDELEELARRHEIHLRLSVDFSDTPPSETAPHACQVGLVTGLLHGLDFSPATTTAAVCGPPVLYGCVLEQLAALGVPAEAIFATMERRMKCGVGLCCHCVAGGVFICREGPVFPLTALRTMEGALS